MLEAGRYGVLKTLLILILDVVLLLLENMEQSIFISYDCLLEKPELIKNRINAKFPINAMEQLVIPRKVVSPGGKFGAPFQPRKDTFKIYSESALSKVNEILNPYLMSHFGYTFQRKVPK